MGSFGGHALPGSFFIIFGLWWTVSAFNRYYSSKRRNARFTSTAIFPCSCLCGWLKDYPVEGYVKLFFVIVGGGLEIITGFSEGRFVHIGNGQHATMFFFFGITGLVDILIYHKAPLPPNTDYVSMAMAVTVEGLLFNFHLHGRTSLDVLVHTLLLYAVWGGVIAVLVEMRYRHNVLSPLARAYSLLVQGTWFWQVGFILYNPVKSAAKWDPEDHEQMMIVTMFFAWHLAANFLIMLVIGGFLACCHRRLGSYSDDNDISMKRLIHTGANGQTVVSLNDDSESDVEFQKPITK